MNRSNSSRAFAALAAFVVAAGISGFAARPAAADGEDAPNPFANLKAATADVASFAKANPNASVDLRSADTEGVLNRLNALVTLTPYERTVAQQRLNARNDAVHAAIKNKSLADDARDNRVEAIERDTENQIVALLTPEQQIRLKVQLGQNRASDTEAARLQKYFMLDARAAGLASPRESLAQWGDTLQLTEAQTYTLLPIIQDEFMRLDAVAANKSLSADEARWQAQEAMIATEHRVDTVLTAAQRSRFDSLLNFLPTTTTDNPRANRTSEARAN